jgi:mRNA interferase MazF
MTEGDVLLAPLRQADGKLKDRPVVFLREMPPFQDFLVCGVSTQLHQAVAGFDEIIAPTDADFRTSGLKTPSVVRLGFLAVLPRTHFIGRIGRVSSTRHQHLLTTLADYLRPRHTSVAMRPPRLRLKVLQPRIRSFPSPPGDRDRTRRSFRLGGLLPRLRAQSVPTGRIETPHGARSRLRAGKLSADR